MATLNLKLLGSFEARLDNGPPLLVSARKGQALLAYLAISRGRPRERIHLARLLWGSRGNEQARNSLRQTLFVLRRALPGFSGLNANSRQVSLDPGLCHTDVDELERLAEHGPRADNSIEAYVEDLLEGLDIPEPEFETWLGIERRHCQDLVRAVLRKRLTGFEKAGAVARAIETAQRLLALDPLQEDIHRSLMRLYAGQGRHGDAARQRELCREVLRRELGVSLSAETEQAFTVDVAPQRLDFDDRHAPGTKRRYPPLVVILPFITDGGDGRLNDFAAGLADDIATHLAAFRLFRVVGPVIGGGAASDPHELSASASYILDGTLRRIADRVHITARILDPAGGHTTWAKRFDRRLHDILAPGAEIAMNICGTVAPILEVLDLHAVSDAGQPIDAWGYYRRGMRLANRLTKADNAEARNMFERAIGLDPAHVRAFAGLAHAHAMDHTYAFVPDRALARARCIEAARRAIELDPLESIARCALAHPLRHERKFDLAIMELERAVNLNPNNGRILMDLGHTLDIVGRPSEGLDLMRKGRALGSDYLGCLGKLARAALNARDYEAAVDLAHEAIRHGPLFPQSYLHLASALGHLGRRSEARAALRACGEASPGFAEIYSPSYAQDSDQDHYCEGLVTAGWS